MVVTLIGEKNLITVSDFSDFFNERSLNVEVTSGINGVINIVLNISAKPGSKVQKLSKNTDGELIVHLRERPIEGQANQALIEFFSKTFGCAKKNIHIDKGLKSKHKKIFIQLESSMNKDLGFYFKKIREALYEIK